MAKAKMLNLDEVAAREERIVVLKGVEYPMKAVSVKDFIEMTKRGEEADEKNMSFAESVEWLIDMVSKVFPTIPKDVLDDLTMPQLNAILELAKGEAEAEEGDESEGKPEA